MTEIDMARQHGHNMEVEFVKNKDAFSIGYKSFLAGYNKVKEQAELKSEKGCETCTKFDEVKLQKAKKLLREMIDTPVFNQMGGEMYENEGYFELVAEVEQFISEDNKC
jgi:hypothetical protein